MDQISIRDGSIRLGQLLKLANLVGDGAEARMIISDGQVLVDGEVETRRGAQVRPGSVVEVGGVAVQVSTEQASTATGE